MTHTQKRLTLVDFVTPPFPKDVFFSPFDEMEPRDPFDVLTGFYDVQ